MATTTGSWRQLDATRLIQRLEEAKALLEQAAALMAAQDASRLTAASELQRRLVEEGHADPRRRPYR